MERHLESFLKGGIMHIPLNDDTKKLIEKVDTTKFGWGDNPILKDAPQFKALHKFEKEMRNNG